MYRREPFLSTDEELVELGNYLIRNNDTYDRNFNYNGNSYKIIRKDEKSADDYKKKLIISRKNESLVITCTECQSVEFLKKLKKYIKGDNAVVEKEQKYELSYSFENSVDHRKCSFKFQLSDIDKKFKLNDFQSMDSDALSFRVIDEDYFYHIGFDSNSELSFIRTNYGNYKINSSCIDFETWNGKTTIKYSPDASKILDIENPFNLGGYRELFLRYLSTVEDYANSPEENPENILNGIKEYDYRDIRCKVMESYRDLKNITDDVFKFVSDAKKVVWLRDMFLDEFSVEDNQKYLYFSKDELQHVISFINGNKISKDNKKELVKTPNEVAQSNSRKGE